MKTTATCCIILKSIHASDLIPNETPSAYILYIYINTLISSSLILWWFQVELEISRLLGILTSSQLMYKTSRLKMSSSPHPTTRLKFVQKRWASSLLIVLKVSKQYKSSHNGTLAQKCYKTEVCGLNRRLNTFEKKLLITALILIHNTSSNL